MSQNTPSNTAGAASGAPQAEAQGAATTPAFSPLYQQIKSLLVQGLQAGGMRARQHDAPRGAAHGVAACLFGDLHKDFVGFDHAQFEPGLELGHWHHPVEQPAAIGALHQAGIAGGQAAVDLLRAVQRDACGIEGEPDRLAAEGTHELEEIRRIWVEEKHEIEDSLPRIYKQATGKKYPGLDSDERSLFSKEDLDILKEIAATDNDEDSIMYQMLREMLHVEQNYRGAYRRHGIFETLEKTLKQHAFLNKEEALEFKLMQADIGEE